MQSLEREAYKEPFQSYFPALPPKVDQKLSLRQRDRQPQLDPSPSSQDSIFINISYFILVLVRKISKTYGGGAPYHGFSLLNPIFTGRLYNHNKPSENSAQAQTELTYTRLQIQQMHT
eukprot:TRINITY_DN6047_c0_g2_i3.p2 TRINITY_DN6047_c0_g2~~TRINITY_DN6047_c0_g2_i3.p2  ORF type:complete len:118 (+),score=3.51 TRINITY_DN6047_c0_g2_i3:257-610(+)